MTKEFMNDLFEILKKHELTYKEALKLLDEARFTVFVTMKKEIIKEVCKHEQTNKNI